MATPPTRPNFVTGVGSLFAGFWFIVSTPSVWLLALVPAVIALGVTVLVAVGTVELVRHAIDAHLTAHSWFGHAGVWLAKTIATLLAILLSALVGFGLAQPLSGPALNRIVRRMEAKEGAPAWPPTSVGEDIWRALQSVALAYAFGLPILAILFLVNIVAPPAAVVTFPLKLLVVSLLAAWDLCDYPLSLRGLPMSARTRFVRENFTAVLGFGLGLGLLSLIPFGVFFALPAGVAGAARLTIRVERARGSDGTTPG